MTIWKVPKITLSAVPSSEDSQGSESHYVHSHSVLLGKDTDASQQRGEAYQAESTGVPGAVSSASSQWSRTDGCCGLM